MPKNLLRRIVAKVDRFMPFSLSRRSRALLLHERLASGPTPSHEFVSDVAPGNEHRAVAARALAAYRAAKSKSDSSGTGAANDVWTAFLARQQRFLSLLDTGRADELAAYLCAMDRMDATHGITFGHVYFKEMRRNGFARAKQARLMHDKLLAFGEVVGAVAYENPEQGSWGRNEAMDAVLLVEAIERKLSIAINPPVVAGGALALRIGGRLILDRDVMSLYAAWRVRQILGNKSGARIAEIGAGVGRAAYWYCKLDERASYTIFDLPHVNVLQGFYLTQADPGLSVRLYDEPEPASSARVVHVMPHFEIDAAVFPPFDLVLNQDSFPEINPPAVAKYLKWIRSTKSRYLLSINQESRPLAPDGQPQLRLADVIQEVGGFSLRSRHPFPLRRGYVEELFDVG